jgi:hypothetical protein
MRGMLEAYNLIFLFSLDSHSKKELCWLHGISIPKKCANIDSLFFVIYHQMTGDEITRNLFPCLGTDLATHQSDRSCSTTALIFR